MRATCPVHFLTLDMAIIITRGVQIFLKSLKIPGARRSIYRAHKYEPSRYKDLSPRLPGTRDLCISVYNIRLLRCKKRGYALYVFELQYLRFFIFSAHNFCYCKENCIIVKFRDLWFSC
jgi:hypothetical protein